MSREKDTLADEKSRRTDETSSSTTHKKSYKLHQHSKDDSHVKPTTNQLQPVVHEEVAVKRTGKKFFTSKQTKKDLKSEKPFTHEDRENVPRVPPLKLRIKAANAAANLNMFPSNDETDETDEAVPVPQKGITIITFLLGQTYFSVTEY